MPRKHELEQDEQDHERGDGDGATETVFKPVNERAVAQIRPRERLGRAIGDLPLEGPAAEQF